MEDSLTGVCEAASVMSFCFLHPLLYLLDLFLPLYVVGKAAEHFFDDFLDWLGRVNIRTLSGILLILVVISPAV